MSIMESMNIGSNALKAHGLRLDIHAKNIANVDTPNYVRRIPVLNASEDISFHGLMNTMKNDVFGVGTLPYLQGGVVFNGCVEDPTVGERIYSPGHPDADATDILEPLMLMLWLIWLMLLWHRELMKLTLHWLIFLNQWRQKLLKSDVKARKINLTSSYACML